MKEPSVRILSDMDSLARAAADEIALALEAALRERGSAAFVLTGGTTPRPVYETLAQSPYRERIAWEKIDFFWGDERCVPPDHSESNYRMAWQTLLSRLTVPEHRIHRILGELEDTEQAALSYEADIRRLAAGTAVPSFDLVLLGMGEDGHTASLFPGTAWDPDRLVVAVWVPRLGRSRVSMTPRLLNAARRVIFLTAGAGKAAALAKVLEDPANDYPARKIQPEADSVTWMVDKPAASLLLSKRMPASSRLRGEDR